jgi:hypothetical protein
MNPFLLSETLSLKNTAGLLWSRCLVLDRPAVFHELCNSVTIWAQLENVTWLNCKSIHKETNRDIKAAIVNCFKQQPRKFLVDRTLHRVCQRPVCPPKLMETLLNRNCFFAKNNALTGFTVSFELPYIYMYIYIYINLYDSDPKIFWSVLTIYYTRKKNR